MDSHSDPNVLDCTGSSPLSLALRTRILATRYDIVDELCKGRAHVNARDGSTYTPLHMAAYYGRTSAARRLIEFGADLNSQAPSIPRSWLASREEHQDPGGLDRKQLFISPQGVDTYTQPTCSLMGEGALGFKLRLVRSQSCIKPSWIPPPLHVPVIAGHRYPKTLPILSSHVRLRHSS
eukprot:Skav208917  [mRNA]  locus=scaffold787:49284:49820:- [translate_table: standard]